MIEPTDRVKAYIAKLADTLEVEGYSTDAKIVRENLKIMNGEKVPMATMDENSVDKELEEFAEEWDESLYRKDAVMAGAKWQKERDKETIEVAEGHAMFAGMEKMREKVLALLDSVLAPTSKESLWVYDGIKKIKEKLESL